MSEIEKIKCSLPLGLGQITIILADDDTQEAHYAGRSYEFKPDAQNLKLGIKVLFAWGVVNNETKKKLLREVKHTKTEEGISKLAQSLKKGDIFAATTNSCISKSTPSDEKELPKDISRSFLGID
ncbi:MAG: hypothetical protein ACQEP8_05800 [Chlamydiota bacterium]